VQLGLAEIPYDVEAEGVGVENMPERELVEA